MCTRLTNDASERKTRCPDPANSAALSRQPSTASRKAILLEATLELQMSLNRKRTVKMSRINPTTVR